MKKTNYKTVFRAWLLSLILAFAASGQTSNQAQTLLPGQTLEREMTGAQTYRYKFDLQAGEFFQVCVEQKGVDVVLKLTDASGNALATMDSPNGKEGFETLSYVATRAGGFGLEIAGLDAKAEKGVYVVKREAQRAATEKDKRRVETERVFVEGIKARNTKGQTEIAVKKLKEALTGWEELKDDYLAELTAQQIKQLETTAIFQGFYADFAEAAKILREARTIVEKSISDSLPAREKANEALSKFRALSSKLSDKTIVEKIISLKDEDSLNDLKTLQVLTKVRGELPSLQAIADTHYNLGEWQKQIDYLKESIKINQDLIANEYFRNSSLLFGNYFLVKANQASLFMSAGQMLYALGQVDEAIEFYNQALQSYGSLFQETQNADFKLDRTLFNFKLDEALVLREMGRAYSRNSESRNKAIDSYSKAVDIYRSFADRKREAAEVLFFIADQNALDLNFNAAFKNIDESLKYSEELDYKRGQVLALEIRGVIYFHLNDKIKASEIFNQIIEILQSPDFNENDRKKRFSFVTAGAMQEKVDAAIERQRLDGIANAYKFLENFQKSNEYLEKSLLIARANRESKFVRTTVDAIAFNYASLKQWDKAAEYYQQAVEISRGSEAKEELADDLRNVGWALFEGGKYKEAWQYQNESLVTYQSVGAGENKAFTQAYNGLLNELSQTHYALGNKRLAIFYGKRAVNAMQGERQRVQNLDLVSQKGFLEKKVKHYRRLAEWLIVEGRFAEAQQVLNSFKDQQFFDFDQTQVKQSVPLSLSPRESGFVARFETTGERVGVIGGQLKELKRKIIGRRASAEEDSRIQKFESDLKIASDEFFAVLKQAENEFSKPADEKDKVGEVLDLIQMQTALRQLNEQTGQKAVAVYQLVGEDNFSALLITPNGIEKASVPIKGAELNEKARKLWALLQSNRYDTTKLSKEIYDVVFKSLETKLPKDTTTIMWSMDGNLRYVPMAALFDGKKFLVERYNHAVFTRAEQERMTRNVSSVWTGTGFGSSQSATVKLSDSGDEISFVALPGVREELSAIFKNQKGGILEGEVFPDEKFSKENFLDAMKQKRPLVHISSHFSFRPGDEARSFLLMGDSTAFTLGEMKHKTNLFQGVELLTLSACNTAAQQAGADGREIDGFAELAQRLGAGAVMATLWQVSDASTPWLMRDFYATRQSRSGMNKAAALQKSQLGLLNGTAKIKPLESNVKGSSTANVIVVVTPDGKPNGDTRGAEIVYVGPNDAPLFKKDDKKPFAHPFYWSPFVLIGNWK